MFLEVTSTKTDIVQLLNLNEISAVVQKEGKNNASIVMKNYPKNISIEVKESYATIVSRLITSGKIIR